jgi:hypothetical protein
MPAQDGAEPATQPDWVLVTRDRMPDRGPRYTETPVDPYAPDAPFVAEPWNAVTASFFIWIVVAWAWRLRGRYRQYPFLVTCMPILLAGGIGGTLYHGTRASVVYFLLDVIPISLLGLAGSLYMALRFFGRRQFWILPAVVVVYIVANRVLFTAFGGISPQLRINLSYASLAVLVLIPVGMVLVKTRFRHGGWVVAGVVSFVFAWIFRLVDRDIGPYLAMGSHWLWHTFGAVTTALMVEYFYLVEGEKRVPHPSLPPDGGGASSTLPAP